ncbi:MAG: hypothetical protein SCH98_15820 [Deferrisomatales bacterium]|nr:hypothetical protein [Deferrisomatales bacterium]
MADRAAQYCRGGEHCQEVYHLCRVVKKGGTPEKVRRLVGEPRYLCRTCGRTAQQSENLCKPSAL